MWSLAGGRYTEITPAQGLNEVGQMIWLEDAGLGLTLWSGQFEEEITRVRLRWCDREGRVIPTGAEGRELERQRAEIEQEGKEAERQRAGVERQRAERLAEGLREMGINPEEV